MSEGLISVAGDAVYAFLFPQGCHVCGSVVRRRASGVACESCWGDQTVTPLFAGGGVCARCGAPGSGSCASCLPASLRAVRSVGEHAGAIRANLIDLKRRPRVCRRLTDELVAAYRRDSALFASEVIVPVPLHPDRLAERGHNQAAVIGEALAARIGLRLELNALARTKKAERRRGGAGRASRASSVHGAFRGARGCIEGARALLVDDLYTTGATADACASALLEAGAKEVATLTVGRVLGR